MKKLNIGIIGCGVISSVHIPIILKKHNLISVCDINENKAKYIAKLNKCTYYTKYSEMLKNENLDVIHILTPHNIRYEIIKLAIFYQIHIIIEKPLAVNYNEAKKILTLLKKHPKINATVIYQNRYNNSFLKLKDELKKQNLGSIIGIEAVLFWKRDLNYYKQSPWRGKISQSGGGLLINQSIHTLDWIQNIGGDILKLSGTTSCLQNNEIKVEVEDTSSIKIVFKNNITAFFTGTLCNCINSNIIFNVICTFGTYSIKDGSLYEIKNNTYKILANDKKSNTKDYYGASHEIQIYNFYDSLLNTTDKDYITINEAMHSLKIVTTIYNKEMKK